MNYVVWDGKTVSDLFSTEFLVSLVGSVLAALLILFIGFVVGGWVRRRLIRVGEKYSHLDVTLFNFLGNVARYVVIGFAVLFVLNTFGVQTTSVVAVIGAAGTARGMDRRTRT